MKIGLWTIVLMAALAFITNRLVVSARDRVTESTLSDAAESTAAIWFQHYSHHMHSFDSFAAQSKLGTVSPENMEDAGAFGEIFRFNLYDAGGRLVFASDRDGTHDAHRTHETQMPQGAGPQGLPAAESTPQTGPGGAAEETVLDVVRSGQVFTQVNDGWKRKNPSEHYSRSFFPIIEQDQIVGVAEIYVDITTDWATIYNSFKFFSRTLTMILTLASLVPISVITYSWFRMSTMNKDLARARDKARSAENVKSRFLANMSHEIRTPLTGVMGMAELLSETELDDEQRRFAATILSSSSALLNIINDILDFSKIEAGKITVVAEPFDLHNCIQDAADLLFPAGHSKGVEVCVDFQKDLPAWVIGDEYRLRQCLLNVAGNAVKFTNQGHVTIRVIEDPAGYFQINVCDTGVGIPSNKLEKIFHDFQQVENSDTRSRDGTGLGLAITRRLLNLMGGEISVESELGKGSCFRMKLPLKPARPEQQTQAQQRPLFFDTTALHGKTAIIVDDLEINRRILTARLASFGMKSSAYHSADAALAAMDAGGNTGFDVIISDHQMPGKTGVDLLKAVRGIEALRDIPFIILSSCDLEELRQELGENRIELFLNKPVRTDLLFKGLCRAMKLDHTAFASIRAPEKPVAIDPGTEIRICVAEDNKTNQLIIEKLLSTFVSDVQFWNNGQEAVDTYLDLRPDLIFMDISMPVKGGLSATAEIRDLEKHNGIPPCFIVALTAHAMVEDRERSRAAGMDGFLTKPIRKDDLIAFVTEVAQRLGKSEPEGVPKSGGR